MIRMTVRISDILNVKQFIGSNSLLIPEKDLEEPIRLRGREFKFLKGLNRIRTLKWLSREFVEANVDAIHPLDVYCYNVSLKPPMGLKPVENAQILYSLIGPSVGYRNSHETNMINRLNQHGHSVAKLNAHLKLLQEK